MREIRRAIKLIAEHPDLSTAQLQELLPKPKQREARVRVSRAKLPPPFVWLQPGSREWFTEHKELLRACRGDASVSLMGRLARVHPAHVLRAEAGRMTSKPHVVQKLLDFYGALLAGETPELPERKPGLKYRIRTAALQLFVVKMLEYSPNYEVRVRALYRAYIACFGALHCEVQDAENALRFKSRQRVERKYPPLKYEPFKRLIKLERAGGWYVGVRLRGTSDPLSDFLQHRCARNPLAMLRVSKLTRAFRTAHPEADIHRRALGLQLSRLGVWRDATRKYYVGLELLS